VSRQRPAALTVGGRKVGPGHPVYIVAEIGINHNGDMELAGRMIEAAAAAGADAVKFQNYVAEGFVGDPEATYSYTEADGREVTENLRVMFKRCELSRDDLGRLADTCRRTGIDWHSTPMDVSGLDDLIALDAPAIKNGSDCLGHLPLIRAMGESGRPVVLATGMATLADVDEAVSTLRETGNEQIIVLHCTSQYPTPAEEANLRRITTLARTFGLPAGFSDHTEGPYAAIAAVAFGACWIEKHFTLDKSLPGPDHRFSADPAELAELVKGVRYVESALGDGTWRVSEKEMDGRRQHRLSCAAARDMAAGEVVREDDIAYMRPGTGFRPALKDMLTGRRLTRSLERGELFNSGQFD
jgi:N-acetylneuraminate synthase/N,N'-diacetyllegionaminate synthase